MSGDKLFLNLDENLNLNLNLSLMLEKIDHRLELIEITLKQILEGEVPMCIRHTEKITTLEKDINGLTNEIYVNRGSIPFEVKTALNQIKWLAAGLGVVLSAIISVIVNHFMK